MLQTMAAADPSDRATAGHSHPNYVASLRADALKGKRIGVLRLVESTQRKVDCKVRVAYMSGAGRRQRRR
jgi:hypothetical protein